MLLIFLIPCVLSVQKNLEKVWIDTDSGDAQALAILYAAFNFNVLGISTIYGKTSAEKAGENVLKLTTNIQMPYHIPVIQGLDLPYNNHSCVTSHGDGMYQASIFPDHQIPIFSQDLTKELNIQTEYRSKNSTFTLLLLGAATNFAKLLQRFPERIKSIGRVIIVGGDTDGCDPNYNCDPEALQILLEILQANNIHITFIPKAEQEIPQKYLDALRQYDKKLSNWALGMIEQSNFSMHKLLGVYFLSNRDQFKIEKYGVEIEENSNCKGYVNFFETSLPNQVEVVTQITLDKFFNNLLQSIGKAARGALMKDE
ncbi:unnamed protein product (macronuclear) [Paramecium tetraurelia]|uniref:Inosine/uridine-preferring nucleoside hydrolase domain-containing protein n=1 Tax=Paramecium tetraurelia TaxID=5888 RepID=A0C4H4_PARTE|nr:uncharacterized protein GSPATT00035171001 [Paramecium tetraurelia]CAK65691.1 unnamed protein product [Paramecium tetraurelia]|eukprot:XP_001433088.1 hypothetical protein (macronuclear) [Paramecium tetraurelia strain d4-2]